MRAVLSTNHHVVFWTVVILINHVNSRDAGDFKQNTPDVAIFVLSMLIVLMKVFPVAYFIASIVFRDILDVHR